jgi:hypothetical protein
MSIILNGTTGITTPADTVTGNATVGGTLTVTGATTLTGAATLTGGIAGDMSATGTVVMGSSFKRNRIINGNMLIDQRNAGASVSATTGGVFVTDRYTIQSQANGNITGQQVSTVPNSGFSNSLKMTVSTAAAPGTTTQNDIYYRIEGYNIADFGFGQASPQSITLSFWAYSSVAGTYSLSLGNVGSGSGRWYVTTYTLTASTWTKITITVPGDSSGTWNSTNGIGMQIFWSLGTGTSYQTSTLNAWQTGTTLFAANTETAWCNNSGATFYVTGVQLEVGTKATPYEMQIYSDQLSQCYRYCFVAPANWFYAYGGSGSALVNFATTGYFPVPMRTTPTATGTIAISNCPTPSAPVLSAYMVSYNSYNSTNGAAAFGNAANYTFAAEL